MTAKSMEMLDKPFKVTGTSRDIKNKVGDNVLSRISTSAILWHLVKRHKFGLVLTWAILMTISYIFPPVWDILATMIIR